MSLYTGNQTVKIFYQKIVSEQVSMSVIVVNIVEIVPRELRNNYNQL